MIKLLRYRYKRCHTYFQVRRRAKFIKKLELQGIGAEIGVFLGDFSCELIKHTQSQKIYFIDPWWKEFGETFDNWGVYTNFGRLSTRLAYEKALASISKLGAFKKMETEVIVSYYQEFLEDNNEQFDWIYLDADHSYDFTMTFLEKIDFRMKKGGVIFGHDWHEDTESPHQFLRCAVMDFCKKYNYEILGRDDETQWAIKKRVSEL